MGLAWPSPPASPSGSPCRRAQQPWWLLLRIFIKVLAGAPCWDTPSRSQDQLPTCSWVLAELLFNDEPAAALGTPGGGGKGPIWRRHPGARAPHQPWEPLSVSGCHGFLTLSPPPQLRWPPGLHSVQGQSARIQGNCSLTPWGDTACPERTASAAWPQGVPRGLRVSVCPQGAACLCVPPGSLPRLPHGGGSWRSSRSLCTLGF